MSQVRESLSYCCDFAIFPSLVDEYVTKLRHDDAAPIPLLAQFTTLSLFDHAPIHGRYRPHPPPSRGEQQAIFVCSLYSLHPTVLCRSRRLHLLQRQTTRQNSPLLPPPRSRRRHGPLCRIRTPRPVQV